jgi:hypothetical protein
VRTRVDDRLRREAARFSLRFACDDCAHFDASVDGGGRCSLGYPAAPRRDALEAPDLELCKSFELA